MENKILLNRIKIGLIIFVIISIIGYLTVQPDPKGINISVRILFASIAGFLLGWALIINKLIRKHYCINVLFLTILIFNTFFLIYYLSYLFDTINERIIGMIFLILSVSIGQYALVVKMMIKK